MFFTDEELLTAIEDNEKECFLTFRVLNDSVRAEKLPEATRLTTGINFWMFNGIFQVRAEPSNAEQKVKDWVEHYRSHSLPFGVFLYDHSSSHELEESLMKHGFSKHASTSVVFDCENLKTMKVPALDPAFKLIPIRNPRQMEAFSACFSRVFQMPSEIQSAFNQWAMKYGFDESLPMQNIAIMHGDRAIAIATYFLDSKIAGIYSIGVDPDYRLQGLGFLIANEIAMRANSRGVRYLVGNGSEEGMHVYRKGGVRALGNSYRWSRN